MVEVMKIMVTSFQRSYACTATLSAPNAAAGHHQSMPPLETPGHSQASLAQSLVGHCSFILGPGTQGSVCALQESISQPCISSGSSKLGLMVTSSQEGLCHTQVCCTQSPCPCGSPLLTRNSTGDGQTQFCLSLCGIPGSWCIQGLFEAPEHLWWEWGLIVNMNSPLLPSCWGFSFALGWGYRHC